MAKLTKPFNEVGPNPNKDNGLNQNTKKKIKRTEQTYRPFADNTLDQMWKAAAYDYAKKGSQDPLGDAERDVRRYMTNVYQSKTLGAKDPLGAANNLLAKDMQQARFQYSTQGIDDYAGLMDIYKAQGFKTKKQWTEENEKRAMDAAMAMAGYSPAQINMAAAAGELPGMQENAMQNWLQNNPAMQLAKDDPALNRAMGDFYTNLPDYLQLALHKGYDALPEDIRRAYDQTNFVNDTRWNENTPQEEWDALNAWGDERAKEYRQAQEIYQPYDTTPYQEYLDQRLRKTPEGAQAWLTEAMGTQDEQAARDNLWFVERDTKYGAIPQNADFEEKSQAEMQDVSGVFPKGDVLYAYINNQGNVRAEQDLRFDVSGGNNPYAKYKLMDPVDVKKYNYIYKEEGKKAAEEYLEYLEYQLDEKLNAQTAQWVYDQAKNNGWAAAGLSALSVPASVMRGVNYIDVLGQSLFNGDKPVNYERTAGLGEFADAARQGTMDSVDWNVKIFGQEKDVFDFLYGTGMSGLDSMAASTLGPVGGPTMLGLSASQSAMQKALDNGASHGQAVWMGAAAGAFELIFEKLSIGEFLKTGKSADLDSVKKWLQNMGKNALTNAEEEFTTSVFDYLAEQAILGEKSEMNRRYQYYLDMGLTENEAKKKMAADLAWQFGEDALGGAFMGTGMGLVADVQGAANTHSSDKKMGQSIMGKEAEAHILELARSFGPGSMSAKAAAQYGKHKSAANLGKVFRDTLHTMDRQGQRELYDVAYADVEKALRGYGETENVENVATAIVDLYAGNTLDAEEMQALAGSEYGMAVAEELIGPDMLTRTAMEDAGKAEKKGAAPVGELPKAIQAPEGMAQQEAQEAETGAIAEALANAAKAAAATMETETGETEAITQIGAKDDGESVIVTESGNEVEIEDAPITEAQKALANEARGSEYAAEMLGAYTEAESDATNAGAFARGFTRIARDAAAGKSLESISGIYADKLSETAKQAAYAAGQRTRAQKMAYESSETYKAAERDGFTAYKPEFGSKAGLYYANVTKKVSEEARTQFRALERYAEEAGLQIQIYDTLSGANGAYQKGSNTIRLSLEADYGAFTKVASHEIYHYIRDWNKDEADKLEKMVMDHLNAADGYSIETRIQEKIAEYAKANVALDEDDAREEIVADALLDFIGTEENFHAILSEDSSLAEKIRAWVQQMMARIRSIMDHMAENNPEVKALKDDGEYLIQIAEMMDGVLERTRQTVEETKKGESAVIRNDPAAKEYREDMRTAKDESDRQAALNGLMAEAFMRTQKGWIEKHPDADMDSAITEFTQALASFGRGEKWVQAALEDEGFLSPAPGRDMALLSYAGQQAAMMGINDGVQVIDGSAVKYNLSTWTKEEEATVRENLINQGFDQERVNKWIKDVNGVANYIAQNADKLDFEASDDVFIKPNSDFYRWSADASTLCEKRRLYQGTYNAIAHLLKNAPLLSDDVIKIRNMLEEKGYKSPCGVCYVESRRRLLGRFSKKWLNTYDGEYIPALDEVTTTDGLAKLAKEHPQTYRDYIDAMNKKGVMNPKVVRMRTAYNQDLRLLGKKELEYLNRVGGLRIFSFSDFEVANMLDMMQLMLDMAAANMKAQGYTKVPAFADIFGGTGMKINLSLIAKGDGLDENGNLVFDSAEGMDIDEAMRLRDKYEKNVGTIVVGATREHILAAWADDRIDMVIPFHRSGWGKKQMEQLGIKGYSDFTKEQNEYTLATGKKVKANIEVADYWDWSKTGSQNAMAYLDLCNERGVKPKFASFLDNRNGRWYLKKDGSTDGYWKSLVDFKMYDNQGNAAEQTEVKADFDMEAAMATLENYKEGDETPDVLPVAQDVVDEFVAQYKEPKVKYSLKESPTAPVEEGLQEDAELYTQIKASDEGKAALQILQKLYGMATRGDSYLMEGEKEALIEKGAWQKRMPEIMEKIKAETGSEINERKLRSDLAAIFNAMDRGEDVNDMLLAAKDLGRDILAEAPGMMNPVDPSVKEAMRILKDSRFYLTDEMKSEIRNTQYGSVAAYMRKNFGKMGIRAKAKDGKGGARKSLAEVWMELNEILPGTFQADATEADMPGIVDAWLETAGQRDFGGAFGQNIGAYSTDLGLSIMLEYFNLPGAIAKESDLRTQYEKALLEMRTAERVKYEERIKTRKEREEMNRAKEQAIKEIGSNVKYLNARIIRESNANHIPEMMKDAVIKALGPFLKDTSVFDATTLSKLRQAYEALATTGVNGDTEAARAFDEDILDMIKTMENAIDGRRLSQLTLQELQMVRDVMANIKTMVVDANEMQVNGRKVEAETLGNEELMDLTAKEDTKREKLMATAFKNTTPAYFFKRMGGVLEEMWNDFRGGQDKWAKWMRDARTFADKMIKDYGMAKWLNGKETLRFTTQRGETIEMDRQLALSLYATWQRETRNTVQNANHLRMGGFRYPKGMKPYEGVDMKRPHALTSVDMLHIQDFLGKNAMEFADKMVGYLSNDMARIGNEVSMQLYGYRKFTEKYYFPYQSSSDFLSQDLTKGDIALEDASGALKNWGAAKKLQTKANNPVVIGDFMDIWAGHVNKMCIYGAFTIPADNMNRLYNYKTPVDSDMTPTSVKQELSRVYGDGAGKYIATLIRDISGGVSRQDRTSVGKMVSKFKKGSVAGNLQVVIQQPSAIARVMAVMNPKYLMMPTGDIKKNIQEMREHSGIAIIKEMGRFDTGTGLSAVEWLQESVQDESIVKRGMDRLDKITGWGAEKADLLTWQHIWHAVKKEVEANAPELEVGSREYFEAVRQRFDEIIDYTQVYDSVLAKSELMRSNSTFDKMTTSFMGEPTVTYNMLQDAIMNVKQMGGKKKLLRATSVWVTATAFNAMLKSLVSAIRRKDDEERTYIEKYIAEVWGNFSGDMDPISLIPIGRDIASLLEGYDVERADMAIYAQMVDAWDILWNDKKTFKDKIQAVTYAAGNMLGIPAKNIWRDGEALLKAFMANPDGGTEWRDIKYSVLDETPAILGQIQIWDDAATAYYARMADALSSGDMETFDELRGYLVETEGKKESTVTSGVKSAVKEHVQDARMSDETAMDALEALGMESNKAYYQIDEWKKEAAHTGTEEFSYSKYDDFLAAVESGANLPAVIKEYMDHGASKSTLSSQITSQYKKQYIALMKTNPAAAANMKAMLLTAYAALGYDRTQKAKDIDKWMKE